ncbi:hypothetical protein [Dactylosporangium salmoneum]|uniref:Uncharacterized protein n=1 Tax=Dactylosporangium salmoneum TaxID=53361 RepID=A0ABP5V7G8_9ACTN
MARLHIDLAEAAQRHATSFDQLLPGALVLATPEAETLEAGWGPLLQVAFPPGWEQRPLAEDQREFLRRLVDNDEVWHERIAAGLARFAAVGLPADREACRALVAT